MEEIKKDLEFLSGQLTHRSFATTQELQAAMYIHARLNGLVDASGIVPFKILERESRIKAAFAAEFIIVSAVATRWPAIAFFYGLFVFIAYMAEAFGYSLLSLLVSTGRVPTVGGSINPGKHKTLLVFTAYLDSGYRLTSHPLILRLSHYLEFLFRLAMVLTLSFCALHMWAQWQHASYPYMDQLHWTTAFFFILASAVILLSSLKEGRTRGANHNASGIAALLAVARKLQKTPLEGVAVSFFMPGGHYASQRGMHMFLKTVEDGYDSIYLVNLESVGAGELCYTASEGALQSFNCSSKLLQAAEGCAAACGARKVSLRSMISNAYLPLTRGVDAISLVGLDEHDRPLHYAVEEDIVDNIHIETIAAAADLAESMARHAFSTAHSDPLNSDASVSA